ncbi:MAG: NAD(P)-dependent oxidoreductase [Pseudomonadota bacterium]
MKNFPIFLNTSEQTIVIAGGGETAAQKSRLVARTEARIVLMASSLNEELQALVASGRAEHVCQDLSVKHLSARLVIAATECAALDASIADLARKAGALVNVVDRPALCDINMPAIVDRDPVVIAIGTEGTAPVLARRIKTAIETMLEPGLGNLAALAGGLRPKVAHRIAPTDRRGFWEWFFGPLRRVARTDGIETARVLTETVLQEGRIPGENRGVVSLIEVPRADADLIPLRAVARMQAADHLAIDQDVPDDVLELARRDAGRGELTASAHAEAEDLALKGESYVALSTSAPLLSGLRHRLEARGVKVELISHAPSEPPGSTLKLAS